MIDQERRNTVVLDIDCDRTDLVGGRKKRAARRRARNSTIEVRSSCRNKNCSWGPTIMNIDGRNGGYLAKADAHGARSGLERP